MDIPALPSGVPALPTNAPSAPLLAEPAFPIQCLGPGGGHDADGFCWHQASFCPPTLPAGELRAPSGRQRTGDDRHMDMTDGHMDAVRSHAQAPAGGTAFQK